jgi:RNA polymerase sigma-70 factor (ECF subfamily)
MKTVKARRRRRVDLGKSGGCRMVIRRTAGPGAHCHSAEHADRAIQDVHDRMVEFLPRLRRFAHSLARDLDQSEDLLQETYARALTHLDQWQPGTRLDSWMFRIAQNLWLDHARAEKLRGEVIDIELVGDQSSADGRTVAESRLALQEVRKGMDRLSRDQRALIGLVCVDGLSYKEAGEILDLPSGTVMSRLARARLALHEAIERAHSSDGPLERLSNCRYGQATERK